MNISYKAFTEDRMVPVNPQPSNLDGLKRLGFGNVPKQPSFLDRLFGKKVVFNRWGVVKYDRATGVVDPSGIVLSVGKKRVNLLPGKLPAEEDWATVLNGQGEYKVIEGTELESQVILPPIRQETCDCCKCEYNLHPTLEKVFEWERSCVLATPDKYILWERGACCCTTCPNCRNYSPPGNCCCCGYII